MPAALTRIYAEFIAGTRPTDIPEAALAVARLGFTDCAGVILAGRNEDVVQRLAGVVRVQGATPASRLVLGAERVSMVQAALVGATASHALDYDDFAFSNHPSAVLVPVILAAADTTGASGARMAAAYVIGYEVWADLFLREPGLYYERGWHPTAVLGPIGAAAAACVVLGLDARATRHALALAASDAGGVFENFGTMAKPWHGGRTAAAGLNAAVLAAAGLEASATALDGGRGLLRALSPSGEVDLDTAPMLGTTWRSAAMRLNIKKYPTVGSSQRVIDAVLALRDAHAIEPARIRDVAAHISNRHQATMPFISPKDAHQAKFSLQFAVASALVHGAVGFRELTDAVVQSAVIQALMPKICSVTTDAYEPGWRDAAPFDIVHVTLDDGSAVSSPQLRRPKGHADLPLSTEELRAKFMGCAAHGGAGTVDAGRLFEAMQRIDKLAGPRDIPVID